MIEPSTTQLTVRQLQLLTKESLAQELLHLNLQAHAEREQLSLSAAAA